MLYTPRETHEIATDLADCLAIMLDPESELVKKIRMLALDLEQATPEYAQSDEQIAAAQATAKARYRTLITDMISRGNDMGQEFWLPMAQIAASLLYAGEDKQA